MTAASTALQPVPADALSDRSCRASKFLVPEVIFGPGTLDELGGAARRMGGGRALVVSDEGVMAAGWVERALPSLTRADVGFHIWHELTPNPKDHEVLRGVDAFLAGGADMVVAIGGGSCIDAAKAIAVLSANGGTVAQYAGIDRVPFPIPPLVMAPTTAGSGADVTQFCVITDTVRGSKLTIAGRALVPNVSIIDPLVLATMSESLTVYTGLDALSHAIEAYVSLAANFLSDVPALAAIGAVVEHLPAAVDRPGDLDALVGMARASFHAGLAFSSALLGATHAISHQIGGLTDLPHGLLNAILLPHVIRFNGAACPQRYGEVAGALGIPVWGMDGAEVVEACADAVLLLGEKLGVPAGLRQLGVSEADIPHVVGLALEDAYITTNPRPVTAADVEQICRDAL